jgi:hypothetical protein
VAPEKATAVEVAVAMAAAAAAARVWATREKELVDDVWWCLYFLAKGGHAA